MNPTKSYKKQIYQIILDRKQISAKSIRDLLNISETTLFKHLKQLINSREVVKIGSTPKVYYSILDQQVAINQKTIDPKLTEFIDNNYLYITPGGEIKTDFAQFSHF